MTRRRIKKRRRKRRRRKKEESIQSEKGETKGKGERRKWVDAVESNGKRIREEY